MIKLYQCSYCPEIFAKQVAANIHENECYMNPKVGGAKKGSELWAALEWIKEKIGN
jgi:hypothetical protein